MVESISVFHEIRVGGRERPQSGGRERSEWCLLAMVELQSEDVGSCKAVSENDFCCREL